MGKTFKGISPRLRRFYALNKWGAFDPVNLLTLLEHLEDWENRKLFSLKEQIDHKINFIQQELQALEVPLIVVGHSIGSYMSLEIFKQIPKKVAYFIALYPFLAVNSESHQQSIIKKISRSRFASRLISAIVALLGLLPVRASAFIAKNSLAKSWSSTAIDALCTSVLKYHTMNNVLYLAMTEFEELYKEPDWDFMRKKHNRIAYLYGDDDHWAPLRMHDEIVKQVPDAIVEVEREGHTHSFCCTMAGSVWVARHVATLINKTIF
uniref:lipid droplet-associated hydrolase isoform X2 n=1 Tax=Erigeron canadensis TaxID=72917 RepID=UPI001CB958AA|nr:lipid droplet-associated hydrolase isoform X2 [Erigeron canadensis]